MKKLNLIITIAISISLCGCYKNDDDCKSIQHIYKPVFKTLTQMRADIKSKAPQPVNSSGKIYLYGNYIFLNEPGKGIHVIDNSDASNPKNVSFINIPGNIDLAVKNNYLYADSYSDLVVFDISDPVHAVAKKFKNNVFPSQNFYYSYNINSSTNPDSVLVAVDYIETDTLIDCNVYDSLAVFPCFYSASSSQIYYTAAAVPSKSGIGGSTARFTVLNNYLYTVDYASIYSFDIKNAAEPQLMHSENISNAGGFTETIYSLNDKLFIGSSNGMFIYSVANAEIPAYVGQFGHFVACDPVIADNSYAYVTLRSGSACQGFSNELEIIDISTDITNPLLLRTYGMTNPRGLAKDANFLFICDGESGLKVYDASDINNLLLTETVEGLQANDVIVHNKVALVIATDGLYQYDYSDASHLKLLSKISISAQ